MARWIDDPLWSDAIASELFEKIAGVVFDQNEIRQIWVGAGLSNADLQWGATPRVVWIAMLKDAHGAGKLEELLLEVRNRRPILEGTIDRALAPLAAPAVHGWYKCADPFTARLIPSGAVRSQIDRSGLSRVLREVAHGDCSVCNITGEPGSGKSHSRFLIRHVARHHAGGVEPTRIDIGAEWNTAFDAVEFASMLARRLEMLSTFSADEFTNPERISLEVAGVFVERFKKLPRQSRWLLIDGLDRPYVKSDVHVFIARVANAAANDELPGLRLFLTGYEADFDEDVLEAMCEEQILPIDRRHVERFFEDIADHQGEELALGVAEALAERALERATIADLRALGSAVSAVASEHFGVT